MCTGGVCSISAPVLKLGLRSKLISEKTKVHMLRNWVASNSFLKNQAAVFEMLQCLNLKEFLLLGPGKKIPELTAMVRKMNLLTDGQDLILLTYR